MSLASLVCILHIIEYTPRSSCLVAPPNMSHNVVPAFSITGPSNDQYDGTICLPQVPLPAKVSFNVGDNITIQVVELAQHGAAIYNVCRLYHIHGTD